MFWLLPVINPSNLPEKYINVINRITEDKIPPATVYTLLFPPMLKAGIGYANLSIMRITLNMCHGYSTAILDIFYFLN